MNDNEFLNWLADRLVNVYGESSNVDFVLKLKALAQSEQRSNEHLEPVAWAMLHDNGDFIDAINPDEHARIEGDYKHALYTTPPTQQSCSQRPSRSDMTWVGLTVEDKMAFLAQDFGGNRLDAMDWAEERLKEKNT